MPAAGKPSFEDYLAALAPLTATHDPTAETDATAALRAAAASLSLLDEVTTESLTGWIAEHPEQVPALGLAVGVSREKLKNILKHAFGSAGWVTLAKTRPREVIALLDSEYELVRLVESQRQRTYNFGDILVARGSTRVTATRAGRAGRRVEDEIESIAAALGLPFELRTRFVGRYGRTAPCDLAIPSAADAAIVVAAKGFDSTGSKQTAAVSEVLEMAQVRTPRQYVMAVIDGIGWKSRVSDLRRMYDLWVADEIDGMYTLADMGTFSTDLAEAARLRNLL